MLSNYLGEFSVRWVSWCTESSLLVVTGMTHFLLQKYILDLQSSTVFLSIYQDSVSEQYFSSVTDLLPLFLSRFIYIFILCQYYLVT